VIVNGQAQEFVKNDSEACARGQIGPNPNGGGDNLYSYEKAKQDFGTHDMEVVLGEYDPEEHKAFAGGVKPYCGKINISLSNQNPAVYKSPSTGGGMRSESTEAARGGSE